MKWLQAEEDCLVRSFVTCTHCHTLLGASIHGGRDGGGSCCKHERDEKSIQSLCRKNV